MTRKVTFRAAYDKRAEGKGQHGVDIAFTVSNDAGAVVFELFTGWTCDIIPAPGSDDRFRLGEAPVHRPIPAALIFHTLSPTYEGQRPTRDVCDLIPGGFPCYIQRTFTQGDAAFAELVHNGEDGLWRYLEERLLSEISSARTQ